MDYFRQFMCIGPPRRFHDLSKPDHLSNVPELVMWKILEKCDFSQIESLRKTCKTFRRFIDDSKPDLKLSRISITVKKDSIVLLFNAAKNFEFEYPKKKDYCSSFFKDLIYLLDRQKSPILRFEVNLDFENKEESFEFCKKLEAVLASRLRPLQVKFLRITVFDENDVISILKHLEPKKLDTIQILNAKEGAAGNLNFHEIQKLEQCKQAKEFDARFCLGAEPISNFVHFERIDIQMEEIRVEDVLLVKETFLLSPTPQLYRIGFNTFPSRSNLLIHLGTSEGNPNKWYFRVDQKSGDQKFQGGFTIALHSYSITFTRIPVLKISS